MTAPLAHHQGMNTPTNTEPTIGRETFGQHHVMEYIECSLSADLTLPEWRRVRVAATAPRHHGLRDRHPHSRRAAHH